MPSRLPLPLPRPRSETWTYALLGGVASIPLTGGAYWLSGTGSYFSLNMVVVGGLVAGYLAYGTAADCAAAGLRAGLIGSLPGVGWLLTETVPAALAATGPLPFRAVATVAGVGLGVVLVVVVAIAGLLGGKAGGWLAGKTGWRRGPTVGN
jgi:hypothetical protein